jgi:flagellar biosynthetic protein FliP
MTGSNRRAFVLHFVEMVVVMFVGMGIFSGLAALAYAAVGTSVSDQSGEHRIMLMGVNMAIPMVLWMVFRGHSAARDLEMAASMLVPSCAAAALVWAGALDQMTGMVIQHAVMVPAMLGVMLWRYDEYAHAHGTRADPWLRLTRSS